MSTDEQSIADLADAFETLDKSIDDFLVMNPKIPLTDDKLVFVNPASLRFYVVSPEIRDLYNKIHRLITEVIYGKGKQNISALTKVVKLYPELYLDSTIKVNVYETAEFHSRRCKLCFTIRLG